MQNEPTNQVNHPTCFRLETGIEVIEEWAETASQARRNVVYEALFAMVDRSLFSRYRVVDDYRRPNEFFVIVKDDLAMKIRVNCYDSFGVVGIGPCGSVSDLQSAPWHTA